jgi:hypothetical protein
MPWTADYYPAAMQNLSHPVKLKAIAIANALLGKGMDGRPGNPYRDCSGQEMGLSIGCSVID